MAKSAEIRMAFIVQGQVQGVGFRPFVWRLANSENLIGETRNTSAGVRIEVQGEQKQVASFRERLARELPPLAKITGLREIALPLVENETSFQIKHSITHAGQNVLISPDVGICAACLADIRDPKNTRYGYPFTNCVNCGPRYTITRSIPYDRLATTMACFELCENCAREYTDPADRRFHAQPIACPECGPFLWLIENDGALRNTAPNGENRREALERAGNALISGSILALKGLGGFQLACDARNADAVKRLRSLKRRPHKALAVMAATTEDAALFCDISGAEKKLLESPEKPIVLCPAANAPALPLSPEIAPDTDKIGVMLPYTPLHALIFDWLAANGLPSPVLVMTSANARDEPICLGNREALARLRGMADAWLLHNRDILARVDDSVVMAAQTDADCPLGAEPDVAFIRRARGYAPRPVELCFGENLPPVLGAGAELKATFCLTRGSRAFLSQHIGDLENMPTQEFYEQTLKHMRGILSVEPQALVRDVHPDYISSVFAENYALEHNLPVFALQHHAAHAAAVLAEHGHMEPALALCLDGLGLGDDGSLWGGELLLADLRKPMWKRLGRLAPFPLPGGDAAAREPWRIARAFQRQAGIGAGVLAACPEHIKIIDEMLEKNINCPMTSSCGRLFDAVAAVAGICPKTSYEGQAAIRLEKEAAAWLKANPDKIPPFFENIGIARRKELLEVDSAAIFQKAQDAMRQNWSIPLIAASFHYTLASNLARLAKIQAKQLNIKTVALGGGVLQNSILARLLRENLQNLGLQPLMPVAVPAGDGGIALGQAVWGMSLLEAENGTKAVKNY